jgi:hypothetical protein
MITTIVGFAISMAFLFLMLSAACSAIQEIVANLLSWRPKTLEQGLSGLLLNEEFKEKVYAQPLIQGLCSPDRAGKLTRRPSYIPSTTLALSILQTAKEQGLNIDPAADPLPADHKFKKTEDLLRSLLRDCKDLPEQRRRLESWFNQSMERVSGWYKRKAHAWIWIFGIILCALLNADAISLSKRFWNDQALRDAVSTEATEYIKSTPPAPDASGDQHQIDESVRRLNLLREKLVDVPLGWCFLKSSPPQQSNPSPTAAVQPAPAPPATQSKTDSSTAKKDEKTEVKEVGLPAVCWPDLVHPDSGLTQVSVVNTDSRLFDAHHLSRWIWKALGIIATVLAISQGASFWFDLLKKAVNLRLSGEPPPTTETKSP